MRDICCALLPLLSLYVAMLFGVRSAAPESQETASQQEFTKHLVAAAIERTHHSVRYVSAYVRIPYPGGDVPADTGVCTDEIIRSYRAEPTVSRAPIVPRAGEGCPVLAFAAA